MALVHLGNAENLEVVDLLLSRRADINAKNPSQSSASQSRLHSMVRSGDVPLLQAWADRKADLHCVDEHGDSLLACARHAHMLEFLMDHKLDVNRQSHVTGNSLLHVLVEEGNLTLLKHLLNLPQVEASLNAESHLALCVDKCGCGGFPKIGVPSFGVAILRMIVFWGIFGAPLFWEMPCG